MVVALDSLLDGNYQQYFEGVSFGCARAIFASLAFSHFCSGVLAIVDVSAGRRERIKDLC